MTKKAHPEKHSRGTGSYQCNLSVSEWKHMTTCTLLFGIYRHRIDSAAKAGAKVYPLRMKFIVAVYSRRRKKHSSRPKHEHVDRIECYICCKVHLQNCVNLERATM